MSLLESELCKEETYTHIRTGNRYVLEEFVEMKDRDTGEWFNAVVYRRYGTTSQRYCRDQFDFMEKFQ